MIRRSIGSCRPTSWQLVERHESTATYRYCYRHIQVRSCVQSLYRTRMRARDAVDGQARRRLRRERVVRLRRSCRSISRGGGQARCRHGARSGLSPTV